MLIKKNKYPIVFTMIEDLGLSSSWNGNALISANPSNFYSMWQKYPHAIVYPYASDTLLSENEEIDLAQISSGRPVPSDLEFLNDKIQDGDLNQNEKILNMIDDAAKRNAALHLIGNISYKTGKYGNLDHALSLINLAKNKKIFRIYLHLIYDDSPSNDVKKIEKITRDFFKKIEAFGIAEVASITGMNYASNESEVKEFSSTLKAIVLGGGERALSPEQAANIEKLNTASSKAPTSVLFGGKFACRINDFDMVFFFNHSNANLKRLMLAFLQQNNPSNRIGSVKMPKFLTVASFLSPFDLEIDQLNVVYDREFENTLPTILSKNGKNLLFLSDTERIKHVHNYFIGRKLKVGEFAKEIFIPFQKDSNIDKYKEVLVGIQKNIAHAISEKSADFIFVDIPLISYATEKSFTDTVKAIRIVDHFLPELEKTVLGGGGTLVLTSNHGGAEKMTKRNHFESLNSKTKNPFPFILSTDFSDSKISIDKEKIFNQMMYDMIRVKHYDIDIAPSVLELLDISPGETMQGSNFIYEMNI